MSKDIKDFVLSCDSCQRNKSSTQKPARLLHPPATPLMSSTHYSIDLIGPLPQSFFKNDYYDCIYVYTDRFSGWVWAIPSKMESAAEDAAKDFQDHILSNRGLPTSIISDRDPRFTSKF